MRSPRSPIADELARLLALLVDQPLRLRVEEHRDAGAVDFEVSVASDDLGKLIGRGGRTVSALRVLLAARGEREGERYALEVRED
jgi:predicted RNA-binding protein YlqC (UPF0109 family)